MSGEIDCAAATFNVAFKCALVSTERRYGRSLLTVIREKTCSQTNVVLNMSIILTASILNFEMTGGEFL